VRARGILLAALGIVLLVGGCLVGGCGDSGGSGATDKHPVVSGARVIPIHAKSFSFSPSSINVQPGEDVTIQLSSDDSFHDLRVEGVGTIVSVNGGQTKSGGLKFAKAGTYTFFCTVPGHRAAGMEGKIVVR
jgi:plastocyanin